MENKVLTQEEIQSLQTIQTNQSNLIQTLGAIEYRIQLLELDKQTLKSQLQKQVEEETKVAKELQEKYGEGNIDLEKGEFTPAL
jgi:translation initiation factor 2 alpha subunit (eIF-2alpha)